MERFRPTKNLNRLKDPKEKLKQFTRLCEAYKIALEGGWSPIDEKANDRLKRQVSSLILEAAKKLFEEYHIAKGTRKKSRQSYLSKVNQFVAYYGQDKKVSEISDYEITEFLNFMEKKYTWAGLTYNSMPATRRTGIGTSTERLPFVFDRFVKSAGAENYGYGLGLSIVKSIADYHHLKLTVNSALNEGTAFTTCFSKLNVFRKDTI